MYRLILNMYDNIKSCVVYNTNVHVHKLILDTTRRVLWTSNFFCYIDLDAITWFLEQNGTDFQFFLKYEKYIIRQIVLYTI